MSDVIILGAGMVGVATALALNERGRSVVLVDRSAPGRETSYGNAGLIQAEAVEPYAMPRDLRTLISIAMRRSNDVSYHFRSLPSHASNLLRYFYHSAPSRHRAASLAYSEIVKRATADHEPPIDAAGSLMDLGDPVEQEPWMGVRPCMPDMLPVVGAAPRHDGLWFHFGHGHQGFTLGPTTAGLLAAAMDGERDPVLEPLSPRRLM